jgi:hypothetical protein
VYTILVYTDSVKNVTFSADEDLIERAREVAKAEHKTLNVAFREWLAAYAARKGNVQQYRALMERLRHIDSGGRYSREEMNER